MTKCDICRNDVEETFLGKIIGTYFVTGKKKKVVCGKCQKLYSNDELKEKLS